jgi:uncharacterized membrane protein
MLVFWCTGIFFPVLFRTKEAYFISNIFIDKIYSLVCHQDKTKSFFISGSKLEVCSRCTGIYLGALIIAIPGLLFPNMKLYSKKILLICICIMTVDILLYSTGIYNYSRLIALITGLILGSVSILYIFGGIDEYFSGVKFKPDVQ